MGQDAKQVWKDHGGHTHDTEEDALAASRCQHIAKRMRRHFVHGGVNDDEYRLAARGITWFLTDPTHIIEKFIEICDSLDAKEERQDHGKET